MKAIITITVMAIIGTIADGKLDQIKDKELLKYASVGGVYSNLIHILKVPEDSTYYGEYYDYGFWDGESYAGYNNLSSGYWVYVYPNWYVWDKMKQPVDNCGG